MIGAFIPELFIIFYARNMRETLEKTIVVMTAPHLSDSRHIIFDSNGNSQNYREEQIEQLLVALPLV